MTAAPTTTPTTARTASTGLALAPALPDLDADLTADLEAPEMTREQAQAVTAAAHHALARIAEAGADLKAAIDAAYEGKAWRALDYPSWAAYCDQVFAGLREVRIPVAERDQLVHALHRDGAGVPLRAAAAALHVSDQTAREGVRRVRAAAQAQAAAASGVPVVVLTQAHQLLADLLAAGPAGLTSTQVARAHRAWDAPWAVLSRAHARGLVGRLHVEEDGATRNRHAVYVHPEHVAGRALEGPGRRRGLPPVVVFAS